MATYINAATGFMSNALSMGSQCASKIGTNVLGSATRRAISGIATLAIGNAALHLQDSKFSGFTAIFDSFAKKIDGYLPESSQGKIISAFNSVKSYLPSANVGAGIGAGALALLATGRFNKWI